MSRSDRGGSVGEYQIEVADRTPLCLRHLPRKGGEGELCIGLLQGELPKAEGVPLPIGRHV